MSYFIQLLIMALFLASSHVFAFEVEKTSNGKVIKWYNPAASYHINTSGGPSESLAAIQTAMKTWSDVPTTSFKFVYGGGTSSTSHGVNDGNNLVSFGSLGQTGMVARNYLWYNVSSGFLFDSDIQFNTDYLWSTDNRLDTYDVQNIATHEFGHSLALKDLYGTNDSDKTMYYSGFTGETKKRTLEQDDINGITYLYPSSYCTFAISPSNQTFNAGGGTGNISITASSSTCNWTATSNVLWVAVTSGNTGVGNGTVKYSVSANTASSSRVGTITVAGETFTVAQSGAQQNVLSVSKMGGGNGTVASSPQGINCGTKCYESFNTDNSVTLTATPDPDSSFVCWISSECSGTSNCIVKLDKDKNVVAIFELQQKNQYTLNLARGWNFISIPQPHDTSIGVILQDISPHIRIVWGYDNQTKTWLHFRPINNPLFQNTLLTIEQNKGYWIYMQEAASLNIIKNQTVPLSTSLYNGWNLIGYHGEGSMDIPLILNNVSGRWNVIWGWRDGVWKAKKDADINVDLFAPELARFSQGEAYWIKMKEGQDNVEWMFDITPPVIVSVSPTQNASNVPLDSTIIVTFSEDMNPSTINAEAFTISTGGVNINGIVTYNGRTAMFKPTYPLSYLATYTATINKSVQDKAGNAIVSGYATTFTTVPSPDSIIRTYKIGDLVTYEMTYKIYGYELKGDVTYQLVSNITNPYGVSCKVYNISGTLTGSGLTVPVSEKNIFYQDAQGNIFDCGDYDSETATYNFITNTNDTPDGLKLSMNNPVTIGDDFSGTVHYQDGSWEQCTEKIDTRETTGTLNGTFNAFKITSNCSHSDGYTSTSTSWFYPSIFFIKQDSSGSKGYQGTLNLKSYNFVQ